MVIAGKRPVVVENSKIHHPLMHTTVAPVHCGGTSYQEIMKQQELKYIDKYNGSGIGFSDIEVV